MISTNKTRKFTIPERNEVLQRRAKGESTSKLAQEYGVVPSAISHMSKRYGQPVSVIKQELQEYTTDIEKRILAKSLKLLEKKITRIDENDEQLNQTRPDHISSVVTDSWKRLQVSEGNPTDITTHKDLSQLSIFLHDNSQLLSQVNPINTLTSD